MKSTQNFITLFLFSILTIIYSYVALSSYGYDDEFHNIKWIEELGSGVYSYVQNGDVHPPLSYLLNYIFFEITGSWSLVRLISAFIVLFIFFYAFRNIKQTYDFRTAIVFFILFCLNPGFLLYLSSLRWYAYALPVIIWLSFIPKESIYRWYKLFIGFVVLAYINYVAFILFLPYLLLYWMKDELPAKEKFKNMLLPALLALMLYSHQFYIFVTVHMHNSDSQTSNLIMSLIGFFTAQAGHIGAFPISFSSILSSIGFLILFIYILQVERKMIIKNHYFISYTLSVSLMIFYGLAGKFRNLMVLSPLQVLLIIPYIQKGLSHKVIKIAVLLILSSYIIGIYNVVMHQNTTKNSWNLPMRELVRIVEIYEKNNIEIFTHDPTITYYLEKNRYKVYSPYLQVRSLLLDDSLYQKNKTKNIYILIKTYRGSIPKNDYAIMINQFSSIADAKINSYELGFDKYYKLKRYIYDDYTPHAISIEIYEDVKQGEVDKNKWLR